MIRVVLDTNIVVSALLQPHGPPAQVFVLALGGSLRFCVSGAVFAEYDEVIRRPRLLRSEEIITSTLKAIRDRSFWVRPTERVRACTDSDDDIFLESVLRRAIPRAGPALVKSLYTRKNRPGRIPADQLGVEFFGRAVFPLLPV